MTRRVFAVAALFAALSSFALAADKTMSFEIYADKSEEFRWRLKDAEGTIVATSGQGYKEKRSCTTMVDNLKADISKYKLNVEEDKAKKFRFTFVASNGQTVGSSSKAYDKKEDAEKVVEAIKKGAKDATIVDETKKK